MRGEESLRREESVRREESLRGTQVVTRAGARLASARMRAPLDPEVGAAVVCQIDLSLQPRSRLEAMYAAGREIEECYRVLHKAGLNIVGEVLRGQGEFVEMNHYPDDDVYDRDTHSQYYYHAHREGEHGHFHTFLRRKGMPPAARALAVKHEESWPEGDDELAHLVAISMDGYGHPIGLFAPNRWVVDDAWFGAGDLLQMLDRYRVDHAYPSWPVNRWISAMLVLFRPHIEVLLTERDIWYGHWRDQSPGVDVLERRDIETYASMTISVDETMVALRLALAQ